MDGLRICLAAMLGMIVGSFVMAASWRLPRGLPWVFGRSFCPACGCRLAARDLVPILSWLLLTGKTRCCGERISWLYPAGEAVSASAFVLPVLLLGGQPEVMFLFVLWGLLALISLLDLSHRYVPDGAVIAVWLTGLVGSWAGLLVPMGEGLLASCAVAAAVLLVRYLVGRQIGREALGLGDVKLFAAAGPWVGIYEMPTLVFVSAGLALLLYPLWRRHDRTREMPFAPAIAMTLYGMACLSAI